MIKHRESIRLSKIDLNTGQIPWLPTNPRQWTRDDLDRLVKSLDEDPDFMEDRPPLVVKHEDRYVAFGGNMRISAEKKRKTKEVMCVVYFPENEEDQLTIIRRATKDNGSWGEWDADTWANEWCDFADKDWGQPDWLKEGSGEEKPQTEAKDDGFDEESEVIEVRCKPGEVWELGDHRLMCGDSISLEDVKKLMGGVEIDLLLTDPPYNVAYEGKTADAMRIKNDSMGDQDFRNFLTKAFAAADSVMKKGASFYIWHADTEGANFRIACMESGWKVRQCLIWNKNSMVMGRQDYQWKHEPCLYGWKEGAGHSWYSDRKQTTVLNFDRPTRNGEHPTMKPVELFAYQMQNSTKAGDYVLDLFGGSGTTMIAAEQLGRKAFLMELDPHYCDVIIARWEKLTGKKATLKTN